MPAEERKFGSLKIGEVVVDPPVLVAPMAGVTDYPFRQLLYKFGCKLLFTEMVSARGLVYGNGKTEELLTYSGEGYVGVQLFGYDPGIMARAAGYIDENYFFDLLDINLGCPAPKIVKNGSGAALMKTPKKVEEIVSRVVSAVNMPVTVKMRAGWDKKSINAVEISELVRKSGGEMVTIHGRTREQFYSGKADRNIICRVAEQVDIPVIGNGDVFTPRDAEEMLEVTGCDGVMVARGLRGNPWLIKRVSHYLKYDEILPEPDFEEKLDTAIKHLCLSVEYFGEEVAIPRMRKHLTWYIKGLPHASERKDQINRLTSLKEVKAVLSEYCEFLRAYA
ncbi:MAG: tRNA dihydrouridine synthase DusB [Halanaerobiaceae bacterium]